MTLCIIRLLLAGFYEEVVLILAAVCIVLYGLGTCLLAVFYKKGHFWLKNGVEVGFCYCDASNLKPEGVKIDLRGESGIELLPLHAENPENEESLRENDQEVSIQVKEEIPEWMKCFKGHWVTDYCEFTE